MSDEECEQGENQKTFWAKVAEGFWPPSFPALVSAALCGFGVSILKELPAFFRHDGSMEFWEHLYQAFSGVLDQALVWVAVLVLPIWATFTALNALAAGIAFLFAGVVMAFIGGFALWVLALSWIAHVVPEPFGSIIAWVGLVALLALSGGGTVTKMQRDILKM